MKQKPSIKVTIEAGGKTYRLALIPQPWRGRYWLRYNGAADAMRSTVEASAFHREPNVLEHTLMACEWYDQHVTTLDDWYFLGLYACLLHDVAKPCCRTEKWSEKRGRYFSYDKHDEVGARMAEEILVRHGVGELDIYRIAWMIDHHQIFWSGKKASLRAEMARILVERDFYLPFKYFMLADSFGRTCDRHDLDYLAFFAEFEREFNISQ